MDSPDVWALNPPNTFVTYKYGKLSDKANAELIKKIQSHFFNKMVSRTRCRKHTF